MVFLFVFKIFLIVNQHYANYYAKYLKKFIVGNGKGCIFAPAFGGNEVVGSGGTGAEVL